MRPRTPSAPLSRWMPTSTTTAPGFTQSAVTMWRRPTAAHDLVCGGAGGERRALDGDARLDACLLLLPQIDLRCRVLPHGDERQLGAHAGVDQGLRPNLRLDAHRRRRLIAREEPRTLGSPLRTLRVRDLQPLDARGAARGLVHRDE